MKLGVSDSKSAATLEGKTNMCVRLAMFPLDRIYQTDLLLLILCWNKLKIFTDKLFESVKSLMSNTCAQLFTDSEYTYIHPTFFLKKAVDGLQNFTEDMGIPAIIMRGNDGEYTGHNTEFIILIHKHCIGDRS